MRRWEKDMFSIGEFSRLTQMSIRMLRYYDEMGLLKPVEVNSESGYRFYSASQIETLQRIQFLRDCGYQVAQIKGLLKAEEQEYENILQAQRQELLKQIEEEKKKIARIDYILQQGKMQNEPYNIGIKKVEPMYIVSYRGQVESYFKEGDLWRTLEEYIVRHNIKESKSVYGNVSIYHDVERIQGYVDIEVGLVVGHPYQLEEEEGFCCRQLEGVDRMAYAMVYGPYENISKGYQRLVCQIEQTKEKIAPLPSRQICHVDACKTENPEEYLTEIQIPLI